MGQTFLSALLVFTQRFVRLPLSSQERGPGGEVLLPECGQKKSVRFFELTGLFKKPRQQVARKVLHGRGRADAAQ